MCLLCSFFGLCDRLDLVQYPDHFRLHFFSDSSEGPKEAPNAEEKLEDRKFCLEIKGFFDLSTEEGRVILARQCEAWGFGDALDVLEQLEVYNEMTPQDVCLFKLEKLET